MLNLHRISTAMSTYETGPPFADQTYYSLLRDDSCLWTKPVILWRTSSISGEVVVPALPLEWRCEPWEQVRENFSASIRGADNRADRGQVLSGPWTDNTLEDMTILWYD
jgi:hypothetical protein